MYLLQFFLFHLKISSAIWLVIQLKKKKKRTMLQSCVDLQRPLELTV